MLTNNIQSNFTNSEGSNEQAFIQINDESQPTQEHQPPQLLISQPLETIEQEQSINIDEIQEEANGRAEAEGTVVENTESQAVQIQPITLSIENYQHQTINPIDEEDQGYKPLEELMQQKSDNQHFPFYQYEQIDLITQPIQMEQGEIILEDEPQVPELPILQAEPTEVEQIIQSTQQEQEQEQILQQPVYQPVQSVQPARQPEYQPELLMDEQQEKQMQKNRQIEMQIEKQQQFQKQQHQESAKIQEQQNISQVQTLNIIEYAQPMSIEAITQEPMVQENEITVYQQPKAINNHENQESEMPMVADPIERDAKDVIELKTIIESNDLKAMRAKIIELIPAQAENINSMCQQEIRDIYKTIELEIIEGGQIDQPPQEEKQQTMQISNVEVPAYILPQEIHEPICIEIQNNVQPQQEPTKEQHVLIEEDAEQIDEPVQIQAPTEAGETVAQNISSDIQGFRALLQLDVDTLRNKLIEIFPSDKDSLIIMDEISLRRIVEEIMLEIQRQGNQINKSAVPQQIPVLQEPVLIQPEEIPKVSIKQQEESEESEEVKLIQERKGPSERQMREQLLKMFPDMAEDLSFIHGEGLSNFYDEAIAQRKVSLEIPQLPTREQPQQTQTISIQEDINVPQSIVEPLLQFEEINIVIPSLEVITEKEGSVSKPIEVNVEPEIQLQQSLESMIKNLLEKYPELQGTLKDLNQEEIRSVYEEVVSLNQGKNNPTKKTQVPSSQVYSQPQETTLPESKNTYETDYLDCDQGANEVQHNNNITQKKSTGFSRSSHSPESAKNAKNGKQEKPHKKNFKLNIKELRAKLIRKMPDLKDKITMLADKQIEKIFMETMSDTNSKRLEKKNEEKRPVIFLKDSSNKFHYADNVDIESKQLLKSKKNGSQTELIEFSEPRKRSRTLLLLHTEDEPNCSEFGKKVWKGNTSNVERCQCDCCRRTACVPPIFRKIFDLLADEYNKDSNMNGKESTYKE